jgi:Trk K+ transport system NAD-binding subunit
MIIGGGILGEELATHLPGATVIECDPTRVALLRRKIDNVIFIHGEGSDKNTLEHAGINDVDTVILATGRDEVNYECAKYAKDFNVPEIIARINNPKSIEKFIDLGIEVVPYDRRQALSMIDTFLHPGRKHVSQVMIRSKSTALGKKIGEIKLPKGAMIASVLRGDHMMPPSRTLKLRRGDILSIHSNAKDARTVIELISGGDKVHRPFEHLIVPIYKQSDVNAFREAALIASQSEAKLITLHPEYLKPLYKTATGLIDMKTDVISCISGHNFIKTVENATQHVCRIDDLDKSEFEITEILQEDHAKQSSTEIPEDEEFFKLDSIKNSSHIDVNLVELPAVDCIIVGHEELNFKDILFKHSTVAELIRVTHLPILVARNFRPYSNILILIDGSPHSDMVLSYVIKIARLFGSNIHAITLKEYDEKIEKIILFLKRAGKIYGVKVNVHKIEGNPTLSMIKRVKSGKFDLIAIKWDCVTIKKDIVRRIVNEAPKSVLVIP